MSPTTPVLLAIGLGLAMAANGTPSAAAARPIGSAELKDLDRRLDLAVNGPGSGAGRAPATTSAKKAQSQVPGGNAQPRTEFPRIALGGLAMAAIAGAALGLSFISKLRPQAIPSVSGSPARHPIEGNECHSRSMLSAI